jgi:hypothetical protein
MRRALAVAGLLRDEVPDEAEETAAAAFRLRGLPWWDSTENQVLVRYGNWQSVDREFSFALPRGWHIDFVFSLGEQRHVGPSLTGAIAERVASPPVSSRRDPVEVMWMRPFSTRPSS